MNSRSLLNIMLLLLAALIISACSLSGTPLSIVNVGAPAINCVFDSDCTITVSDLASTFTPPFAAGDGFLQSRSFPRGEAETQATGIHAYLYRIDLRDTAGITAIVCITSFSINFGPLVPLDFDGDGSLDDAFVITSGGLGNVQPTTVTQTDGIATFMFEPAICPGSQIGGGHSSYFFGLSSVFPPRAITAELMGTSGLSATLDAHAPDYLSASEPTIAFKETTGMAGSSVTIPNAGFVPGGYVGTIFWDDGELATFDIPRGGAFLQPITIPMTATSGVHTITVCAFNPCATGDVEQKASADFLVIGTPPATTDTHIPLYSWWSPGFADNVAMTWADWAGQIDDVRTPDYHLFRVEGHVFNPANLQPTGTTPLYTWYSPSRNDYFTTANPSWAGNPGDPPRSPDYQPLGLIGYIYTDSGPNRVPLHSWYDPDRGDNFITSQAVWHGSDRETRPPNYRWVRLEGYAVVSPMVTPPAQATLYLPIVRNE